MRRVERVGRGGSAIVTVLVGVSMLLAGCGHDVSGSITSPQSGKNFARQPGVEVLLVRGDLRAAIDDLLAREGSAFGKETEQAALGALAAERREVESGIEEAKKRLQEAIPSDPPLSAEDCLDRTTSELERAKANFSAVLADLRGSLAPLGIDSEDVTEIVAQLETRLSARLEGQAAELARRYPAQHVTVRSRVTFGVGHNAADQLCWTVTNDGPIAVNRLDFYLTYDGKRVPDGLARHVWSFPAGGVTQALVVRNDRGEEVLGLASGARLERCMGSKQGHVERAYVDVAQELGLPEVTPSRSAKWAVGVENVQLAGVPPERRTSPGPRGTEIVYWEHVPRPAAELFADALSDLRARQPEAALLDRLTRAPATSAFRSAQAAQEACNAIRSLATRKARADKLIAGLEGGKSGDAEVRKHLLEFLDERKKTRSFVASITSKAERLREQAIVDVKRTGPGGSFSFDDVPSGTYTLVSTHTNREGEPFTAMVTLNVGHVFGARQDVTAEMFKPGTLAEIVETRLTGKPPAPRPTPRPTTPPSPAAGARKKPPPKQH